jgi:RNA polymerase sigma-70 factor (ECF subfamily)
MTDNELSDIPPSCKEQGKPLTQRSHKLQEQQELSLGKQRQNGRELFLRFFRLLSRDRHLWHMRYQEFCVLAVGYMAPLYNTARRITGDPYEAEDLVQDTYQRALQAYRQLKSPAQCRAWLYQILRNLFIDAYRRKRAMPELVVFDGARDIEEGISSLCTASPEEEVLRRLSHEEVHRALAALPEELRTALMLCDIEGFTYQEIADILGCPVGTVRSRIARARRALLIKFRSRPEFQGLGKEGLQ